MSRCVEERQELRADVRLNEPSGVRVDGFIFPTVSDLRTNHGNHEGYDGMDGLTVVDVVDELERQTRYALEAVKAEASWTEGSPDVIVVRHGSATLAIRGKSLRL